MNWQCNILMRPLAVICMVYQVSAMGVWLSHGYHCHMTKAWVTCGGWKCLKISC